MEPLKYHVKLNPEAWPEDTDPDTEIHYVDIGNVVEDRGITDCERMLFGRAPSRARRKVRADDVIISTVRTYLRAASQVPASGPALTVSTGFAVLRPDSSMDSRFLYYAIVAKSFIERVEASSVGVSYPAINAADLVRLSIPSPPKPVQRAIADFLDRETGRIDALCSAKVRLLALLRERQAAFIDHLLTVGAHGDVPLKDAGLPGGRGVPAHWDVRPLKQVAEIRSGLTKGRVLVGAPFGSVPYLRVANVQDGFLDLDDVAVIPVTHDELRRFRLRAGDVLMNEGGDRDKLGRGAVWNAQIDPCVHQNHVFAIRPHPGLDSAWVTTITKARFARDFLWLAAKQTTGIASISASNLGMLPIVLPPLDERQAILDVLSAANESVDLLTTRQRRELELLKERRSALITAAVTGQLDVSSEAA
jgi:type I restriction enzyme, S subunit